MTDQTIPAGISPEDAKKAREWALHALNKPGASTTAEKAVARVVIGTVPEPRPTLADMTPEEREECRWMQADVENRSVRYVIATPYDEDSDTALVSADGEIGWMSPERVTPRPDLPRWELPGDQKPDPALPDGWRLADHQKHGRVIVTNPNQESDGYSYCIFPSDMDSTGFDWHPYDPEALTYIDQEGDTPAGPNTLAVGSVWDDADALTRACAGFWRDQIVVADKRGMVGVWDTGMQCWRVSAPHADFAPYTIIHTGQGVDQ